MKEVIFPPKTCGGQSLDILRLPARHFLYMAGVLRGRLRLQLAMTGSAFTLIEITIALMVLAVGLVGLLSLFPVGFDASRRAADVTVATFLAQEKLEEAKRLGFDDYTSLASIAITPFPAPYERFSYTITVAQDPPPMTGLKEVQVVVSWPAGGGGTRDIDLKTYVADYGP